MEDRFNPSQEMTAVPTEVQPADANDGDGFNPSQEMTAVPTGDDNSSSTTASVFQPLSGNDGRTNGAALS